MFSKYLSLVCVFYSLSILRVESSTEYNRYLAHLFQKYGNGGTITFEGLEHLMYSLGLGQIEFEPAHTIEEHRPKGFNISTPSGNNTLLKTYFEQQAKKLLNNDDNLLDVQLSTEEKTTTATQETVPSIRDDKVILEFREMHDPKHRHPRENGANLDGWPQLAPSSDCLSPKALLNLVVDHEDLHKNKLYKEVLAKPDHEHDTEHEYNEFINSVRITPVAFMKLCPVLLAQIDNDVCVRSAPRIPQELDERDIKRTAWILASITTIVLSAFGFLGILLVPLMKYKAYKPTLRFLVAISAGTLSADALMHLLPHALTVHSDMADTENTMGKHNVPELATLDLHTVTLICFCTFCAALLMFIIENFIPLIRGGLSGHAHGSIQDAQHSVKDEEASTSTMKVNKKSLEQPNEINEMLNENRKDKKTPSTPLSPIAMMVVFGDCLHNMTDGLAIGAAFADSTVAGFATAFAVLCHELPHELGDFALLLQSGVSVKRALFLSIVSSVLSFVGMAIGILIVHKDQSMVVWIYAATAGSFLYIAFADLIPTMSIAHHPEDYKGIFTMSIQILGILIGGLIMLAIALNEHNLDDMFKKL